MKGDLLADYSFQASPAQLQKLKDAGYKGIIRYTTGPKACSADEVNWCADNGFMLGLTHETTADRVLGGAPAAREDAHQIADFAASLPHGGYPLDLAFTYDVDFDIMPPQFGVAADYFEAAINEHVHPVSEYGRAALFQYLLAHSIAMAWLWEAYAWSGQAPLGEGSSLATFYQRYGVTRPAVGFSIDENIQARDGNFLWTPGAPPPPTPIPTSTTPRRLDMETITNLDGSYESFRCDLDPGPAVAPNPNYHQIVHQWVPATANPNVSAWVPLANAAAMGGVFTEMGTVKQSDDGKFVFVTALSGFGDQVLTIRDVEKNEWHDWALLSAWQNLIHQTPPAAS